MDGYDQSGFPSEAVIELAGRRITIRHFPAFIQNMTDGDAEACQVDHGLGRKPALVTAIHIAGDGRATRYSDVMG